VEKRLGAQLLNRTTRNMSVTDIGEAYYESCRNVVAQVEKMEEDVALLQGTAAGRITVRMSHSIGLMHIGEIILSFCAQYPSIKVSISFDEFPLRSIDVMERCSDVILHSGPVTSPGVVARELAPVVWLPFASPAYLKKFDSPRTPGDLISHNCLVHQTVSPNNRWRFSNAQGEISIPVSGTISSNSVLMLKEAAETGMGVALLPSYCTDESLLTGKLVRVLPDYQGLERHLYVAYEATGMLPKRTRLFIDFMAERLKTPWENLSRKLPRNTGHKTEDSYLRSVKKPKRGNKSGAFV
jgi:DNA-binding transcriptional LysR family regulator